MRWLNPTAAVLIAALLALFLISYVFAGSGAGRGAGKAETRAQAASRCSSPATSELLKRDLFAKAVALRGRDGQGLTQVGNYSAVRMASAAVRRHDPDAGTVLCAASLVVDLPLGVSAADGRRSLSANVEYQLGTGAGGASRLRALNNADAIITSLASLVGDGTGDAAAFLPPAEFAADQQMAEAVPPEAPPPSSLAPPARPQPREARPPIRPAPLPVLKTPRPRQEQRKTASPRRVAQPGTPPPPERRQTAESPPPPAPARSAPRVVASAKPPAAAAKPSFNCARAKTRSEIAVCSDSDLAGLDRQMSGQFFRALAVARPGQRAILQRSRTRFLAYRNACASKGCIAEAYAARMREIDDIMSGAW
jgi:hypothetical protein